MGRPKLPEQKSLIAARVSPRIRIAIKAFARQERRTESQAIEILLEQSPEIKARLKAKVK